MLNTEQRQDITFFEGYEVEHTVCYGMKTLFVVGTPDLKQILELANNTQSFLDKKERICQIYFGTSQSFNPANTDDWKCWDEVIRGCLEEGYWVTLDFDVRYANDIHECSWCEYQKFVPMISVKLPNIHLYNYNATLKIDDTTWGATNPGVWTHHLQSLMNKNQYTHWDQYTEDTSL